MTTLGNFTAGDVLQASDLNQFNNVTALEDRTALTINNTTVVNIGFGSGSELCDPSNWHNTTTNNDRITPTIAGSYLVSAYANLEAASFSTGSRLYVSIAKNGGNHAEANFYSPRYPSGGVTVVMNLNGTTDYVQLQMYQDSGSNINSNRRALSCMLLRAT